MEKQERRNYDLDTEVKLKQKELNVTNKKNVLMLKATIHNKDITVA